MPRKGFMRTELLTISLLLSLSHVVTAETLPPLNLMPMPANVQLGTGQLAIDQSFSVAISGYPDAMVDKAVQRFIGQLSEQTGMLLVETLQKKPPTLSVKVERGKSSSERLGEDESYQLQVTTSSATLSAPNALGIFHGLQTFLQLVETGAHGFYVPAVAINDEPRFAWRGLLIDVGRHYIPVDVLKRNIDGMAAVKLNRSE